MRSRVPVFRAQGTGFGLLLLGLVGLVFALLTTLLVGLLLAPVRLLLGRAGRAPRRAEEPRVVAADGNSERVRGPEPDRDRVPLADAVDVRYEEVS